MEGSRNIQTMAIIFNILFYSKTVRKAVINLVLPALLLTERTTKNELSVIKPSAIERLLKRVLA